jgi:hypothetical protein
MSFSSSLPLFFFFFLLLYNYSLWSRAAILLVSSEDPTAAASESRVASLSVSGSGNVRALDLRVSSRMALNMDAATPLKRACSQYKSKRKKSKEKRALYSVRKKSALVYIIFVLLLCVWLLASASLLFLLVLFGWGC